MCLNKALCCAKRITGRIDEALGSVVIDVLQTGRSYRAKNQNTKPLIYYLTEHTSNNNEQVFKLTVI